MFLSLGAFHPRKFLRKNTAKLEGAPSASLIDQRIFLAYL